MTAPWGRLQLLIEADPLCNRESRQPLIRLDDLRVVVRHVELGMAEEVPVAIEKSPLMANKSPR